MPRKSSAAQRIVTPSKCESARLSERTVRPCDRSPPKPTRRPSSFPSFSTYSVSTSSMACVGCSFLPSPPLMTGTAEQSAAHCSVPSRGWRITSTSKWLAHIMATVSRTVSFFMTEVPSVPENPS